MNSYYYCCYYDLWRFTEFIEGISLFSVKGAKESKLRC